MSGSDFSELDRLNRDLSEVANVTNRQAKQVVQQAAMNTKKAWAKDAAKGVLGSQYAPTIDYTLAEFGASGAGVYAAEIGPDLARYGGKTGKGGLVPSFGIFDDPRSSGGIRAKPSRARPKAEKFAGKDLEKGIQIAVDKTLKKLGL